MSEPLRKMWSEEELCASALEFMRCDFGLPRKDDSEERDRWHERLGLLVVYSTWLWDTHDASQASDATQPK